VKQFILLSEQLVLRFELYQFIRRTFSEFFWDGYDGRLIEFQDNVGDVDNDILDFIFA
jgi:hypothetical protein